MGLRRAGLRVSSIRGESEVRSQSPKIEPNTARGNLGDRGEWHSGGAGRNPSTARLDARSPTSLEVEGPQHCPHPGTCNGSFRAIAAGRKDPKAGRLVAQDSESNESGWSPVSPQASSILAQPGEASGMLAIHDCTMMSHRMGARSPTQARRTHDISLPHAQGARGKGRNRASGRTCAGRERAS